MALCLPPSPVFTPRHLDLGLDLMAKHRAMPEQKHLTPLKQKHLTPLKRAALLATSPCTSTPRLLAAPATSVCAPLAATVAARRNAVVADSGARSSSADALRALMPPPSPATTAAWLGAAPPRYATPLTEARTAAAAPAPAKVTTPSLKRKADDADAVTDAAAPKRVARAAAAARAAATPAPQHAANALVLYPELFDFMTPLHAPPPLATGSVDMAGLRAFLDDISAEECGKGSKTPPGRWSMLEEMESDRHA